LKKLLATHPEARPQVSVRLPSRDARNR
jgi:hypothetical protein